MGEEMMPYFLEVQDAGRKFVTLARLGKRGDWA